VTGNPCVKGSCGAMPNGGQCSSAKDCQSGYCAQGVCCNSDCTAACMTCNLTSSLGKCTAVADNSPDPQAKCAVTLQNTCGTTGACKSGAYADWDKGKNCAPAACATNTSATPASACDGAGKCVTPNNIDCGNYICSVANKACNGSCKTDADCNSPNSCVNGSCGRRSNGAACSGGDQCSSGFCTEGVCCDSACADASTGGLCKSCKVSGNVGKCSNVASGQSDPKQRCAASNPSAGDCSNDGTCNGNGACRPWLTTMGCRNASCTGHTLTAAANCDGAGHCPASTTSDCGPFPCNSGSASCLTTCTSDANCFNETCLKTTNRCGNKLANGQDCQANSDCVNNVCTEGVCCNTACGGACQSCAVSSKVGTCSNIAANGTPRDNTTCAANPPCGNTGKCGGAGSCQLAGPGTGCGNASCSAPVSGQSLAKIPAPTCDGSGKCQTGSPNSCGA